MAVYGLVSEGFMPDKIKKAIKKNAQMREAKRKERERKYKAFYKDESAAIKDVKEQIKKIAPKVVSEENRNSSSVAELNKAVDHIDADMFGGKLVRKFVYRLVEEADDHITIVVLDKSISDAINKVGNLAYDDPLTSFTDDITTALGSIYEKIESQIESNVVKVVNDYSIIYDKGDPLDVGQITFWFEPKYKR